MNNVLSVIQNHSAKQPATRTILEIKTGLCDRQIRKNIEKLRLLGYPIISTSKKQGYYIAESNIEIQGYILENQKRIIELEKINQILKEKTKC